LLVFSYQLCWQRNLLKLLFSSLFLENEQAYHCEHCIEQQELEANGVSKLILKPPLDYPAQDRS
jgi:hypothetical protein